MKHVEGKLFYGWVYVRRDLLKEVNSLRAVDTLLRVKIAQHSLRLLQLLWICGASPAQIIEDRVHDAKFVGGRVGVVWYGVWR